MWQRVRGHDTESSAYARLKAPLQLPPGEPPYRVRMLRCYDERFLGTLAAEVAALGTSDIRTIIELWHGLPAAED